MNADSRAYSQKQQAINSLFGTESKFQSDSLSSDGLDWVFGFRFFIFPSYQ